MPAEIQAVPRFREDVANESQALEDDILQFREGHTSMWSDLSEFECASLPRGFDADSVL